MRRDFNININININALLMDVRTDEILDFVGGRRDLEARLVRAIGDPERRFLADHLRLLRAARFAARFGFEIETETFEAIRRNARLIHKSLRRASRRTDPHSHRKGILGADE